eukprot:3674564-Rhodomonas_salina.1
MSAPGSVEPRVPLEDSLRLREPDVQGLGEGSVAEAEGLRRFRCDPLAFCVAPYSRSVPDIV